MSDVDLRFGDALAVLRELPDASVDAVVTDPPYGLAQHRPDVVTAAVVAWAQGDRERVPDGRGFMGRDWDAFVPPPAVWDECLRVLKPGGHLVAFAGSRTADLMGLSIRMAGFEIRDGLQWIYGSGFPKSLDVGKAIDKAAGVEREVVGSKLDRPGYHLSGHDGGEAFGHGLSSSTPETRLRSSEITAPATPDAQRWQGWGTALKPAVEPIVLARKPMAGTVAATVLAHGTGALNIDGCRVGTTVETWPKSRSYGTKAKKFNTADEQEAETQATGEVPAGRWPSNVLLTHGEDCAEVCVPGCPVVELDAQTGTLTSGKMQPTRPKGGNRAVYGQDAAAGYTTMETYGDTGGASRFFPTFRYQAKAPSKERPKIDGQAHPTVKPLALMAWLVRLVTPPGGTVLDPFAGSGTTLQAARDGGFTSIGIERWDLAYRLSCQRLGLPDELPVPVLDEPPADPVLVEVAAAGSYDELTAVWEVHVAAWTDEHTAAVRARLAELGERAA